MSIYIRSTINAPHDCGECFLESEGGCCLAVNEYKVTQYYSDTRTKPEWCPLVHVPDHGRLIDADALKASLVFAEETASWAVPALRAVLKVIDEMPTIIPAGPAEEEEQIITKASPASLGIYTKEGEG